MSDEASDGDRGDDPFASIDDRDGDPFERIDQAERGDPFETLPADPKSRDEAPAEADRQGKPTNSPDGTDTEPGRFDELSDDWQSASSGDEPEAAPDGTAQGAPGRTVDAAGQSNDSSDDPFEQIGRDGRDGDPFEGFGEDRARGERPADDDLWESLSRRQTEPETERRGQRRYAEVSKHSYCVGCEYFSKPPEIACGHDGTDIIEFVDSETVRVADCPIVAERERLADLDSGR